jgi:hypothetical protein
MCLETMGNSYSDHYDVWSNIDLALAIVFSIELGLRLIARATDWRTFRQFIFSTILMI